jgi:hypothetical protein
MRQRHPTKISTPARPSIVDLLVGCPQVGGQGNNPGRLFFVFLTIAGMMRGFTLIPAATDSSVGLNLKSLDRFGWSMAGYFDIDKNGIKEILVGAPGDDEVTYLFLIFQLIKI